MQGPALGRLFLMVGWCDAYDYGYGGVIGRGRRARWSEAAYWGGGCVRIEVSRPCSSIISPAAPSIRERRLERECRFDLDGGIRDQMDRVKKCNGCRRACLAEIARWISVTVAEVLIQSFSLKSEQIGTNKLGDNRYILSLFVFRSLSSLTTVRV
jgi:hypothetical protein